MEGINSSSQHTNIDEQDITAEICIILRGNTKAHKEKIKKLGGLWYTRDGDLGWILSFDKKEELEKTFSVKYITRGNNAPRRYKKVHLPQKEQKDAPTKKKIINSYQPFYTEQKKLLMKANPHLTFNEASKLIAQKWKSMTKEEKQPYVQKFLQSKQLNKQEETIIKQQGETTEKQESLIPIIKGD